jgi:hypothetical protein
MKNKFILSPQLMLLCFFVLTITLYSCKKQDSASSPTTTTPTATYPKTVTIEYIITPTGIDTAESIFYKNETGGSTTLSKQKLPFSKKITRTVKQYDDATLHASTMVGGQLKLDIKVDNALVASKTAQGTTSVSETLTYVFP